MSDTPALNVTVWGEGEPAVFVHGSFGWGEENVACAAAARRPVPARPRRPSRLRRKSCEREPPALSLLGDDLAAVDFSNGVQKAMAEASDPSDYRARFLRNFGFPAPDVELEGPALEAARASWHERNPGEAVIPFDKLRDIPALVVRGDWGKAPPLARERGAAIFHAICDVIERRLQAESAKFPAAHRPQELGKPFNDTLRAFWETA